MINGQTLLAVIPARGGSKRVPRKNLREYRGKPLIQWAIEAARQSVFIDGVVVSTDDEEIREACESLSVIVVRRPKELAADNSSSEDALRHLIPLFEHEWIVLLQPTSPLRTAEDIDACIERAQMGDGCISIDRSTGHPNGAVYVAKAEWIAKKDFHHAGLMRYPMDPERSLDIDTEADFDR